MFERFTERARQVVVLAQDEARALRHNYLGTEHILLGLLREEEGLAARMLDSFDIRWEEVRAKVVRLVGQGDEVVTGQIPFTKHATRVLELALREALSLGHNYIGTEHILLGLIRENESIVARILLDYNADREKVRDEVIRMLSGPGRPEPGEGAPWEGPRIELGLRRVVPVAQQMSDGTWVVSVEVWDHGLVVRWATSAPRSHPDHDDWLVSYDAGTSYHFNPAGRGTIGTGSPQHGYQYASEFEPGPRPETTSLLVRRKSTGEELSISLTD